MKRFALLCCFFLFVQQLQAKEGMWLPQLLSLLNESDMKSMGMQITAEDIYSVAHTSLKDAVVQFGGGCTGEIVSDKGLLLTNHHCGFSQIQSLSSMEKNYLRDGFWAATMQDEIPCPGLTVTFIVSIDDVTDRIKPLLADSLSEEGRERVVKSVGDSLSSAAVKGTDYKAFVRSFFQGNSFFLFKTEVFRDIRFVGAPPVALGKFGGETDNWVWPRHTCDFSVFRIYASKENKPAAYAADNVPYHPRYVIPVNIGGPKEGDFAFSYGFPGRTNEFLPSFAVEMIRTQTNPGKVNIRQEKLRLWHDAMSENDTVQLKYAAKYRGVANYYKKWKGEVDGLTRTNAVSKKIAFEQEFLSWVKENASASQRYAGLLDNYREANERMRPVSYANDRFTDALLGIELVGIANKYKPLFDLASVAAPDRKQLAEATSKLSDELDGSYKNYVPALDEKICAAMLKICMKELQAPYRPSFFSEIEKRYRGDASAYTADVYRNSMFVSPVKVREWLKDFSPSSLRQLKKDPAWQLSRSIAAIYDDQLSPAYKTLSMELGKLQRRYTAAIMEMKAGTALSPDANSTLRLTYGKVEGMTPRDGIVYRYQTTLDGLMEKGDPSNEDFIVPDKLKALFERKDYGAYAVNGTVPLAFLGSMHTTNGNSGSPTFDAKGQLIGINYDRTWEGVMSDYIYDDRIGRNISLDVRFVLFIIEKFGGDKRLVDEMHVVKD